MWRKYPAKPLLNFIGDLPFRAPPSTSLHKAHGYLRKFWDAPRKLMKFDFNIYNFLKYSLRESIQHSTMSSYLSEQLCHFYLANLEVSSSQAMMAYSAFGDHFLHNESLSLVNKSCHKHSRKALCMEGSPNEQQFPHVRLQSLLLYYWRNCYNAGGGSGAKSMASFLMLFEKL